MFSSDKNNNPPENPQNKTEKTDPISALYVDKTPEELEADERIVEFFVYILERKSLQELLF